MGMFRAATVALFGLLVCAGSAHAAGPRQGQLGLNLAIGQDIPVNGSMHEGIDNTYPNIGLIFPSLNGQSGRAIIGARSYDDFYGPTLLYRLDATWAHSDNLEFLIQVSHTEGDSDRLQIGTLAVPSGGAAAPLYARFSPYRSTALEAGVRAWLGERGNRFRPYTTLRLGAARTDGISATFSAPDLNSGDTQVPFYDDTTSATGGIDFGVAYEVARARNHSVELGAEIGFRYTGALDENDTVLGGIDGASLNDKSGRVSVPVTLSARVRWGGSSNQSASRF